MKNTFNNANAGVLASVGIAHSVAMIPVNLDWSSPTMTPVSPEL